MKSRKFRLSVGIPAHNEERNIGKLLEQIVDQRQDGYVLYEVLVMCDGCTDKTAEEVEKFGMKYKYVKVYEDGKRLGKAGRINQILKTHKGDAVVCLDADTKLLSKGVFESISKCFISDGEAGLIGGNDGPQDGENFFGKVAVAWVRHWFSMNRPLNDYDNSDNCHGCLYAVRRDLAQQVVIPNVVVADDLFIYWKAREMGYGFKFCEGAKVAFKVPDNFSDFMKQSVRFGQGGADAMSYFTDLPSGHGISMGKKIFSYLKSFLINPFWFSMALGLQILVKIKKATTVRAYSGGVYETVKSSK